MWGVFMRITNLENVTSVYQKSTNNAVTKQEKIEKKDKIEISKEAREYQLGLKKVNELPEIRQDKVDAIKKQIQDGSYSVDSNKIADKILNNARLVQKYNEW